MSAFMPIGPVEASLVSVPFDELHAAQMIMAAPAAIAFPRRDETFTSEAYVCDMRRPTQTGTRRVRPSRRRIPGETRSPGQRWMHVLFVWSRTGIVNRRPR